MKKVLVFGLVFLGVLMLVGSVSAERIIQYAGSNDCDIIEEEGQSHTFNFVNGTVSFHDEGRFLSGTGILKVRIDNAIMLIRFKNTNNLKEGNFEGFVRGFDKGVFFEIDSFDEDLNGKYEGFMELGYFETEHCGGQGFGPDTEIFQCINTKLTLVKDDGTVSLTGPIRFFIWYNSTSGEFNIDPDCKFNLGFFLVNENLNNEQRILSLEDNQSNQETRITALESWKQTIDTWKTTIDTAITNILISITGLVTQIDYDIKIAELEARIEGGEDGGSGGGGAPGPPVCGNGDVETGEECDDGNLVNGDGCSDSCDIEVVINDNVKFRTTNLDYDRGAIAFTNTCGVYLTKYGKSTSSSTSSYTCDTYYRLGNKLISNLPASESINSDGDGVIDLYKYNSGTSTYPNYVAICEDDADGKGLTFIKYSVSDNDAYKVDNSKTSSDSNYEISC